MGESLDADPDLSKDTKLKKLFRDTTDWMFDTSKPVAKYDKPWYHPGRFFDSQAGEDPIKTPQTPDEQVTSLAAHTIRKTAHDRYRHWYL